LTGISGAPKELEGNLVEFEDGPAAVTGDERCIGHCLPQANGKAQQVGRTGSQKTCLKTENHRRKVRFLMVVFVDKRPPALFVENQGIPGSINIGPGIFFA